MMEITVYYFAFLREERKTEKEIVTIHQQMTAIDLFTHLFNRSPSSIRYAVNEQFVPPDTPLSHQDEIAFIPPLGGG